MVIFMGIALCLLIVLLMLIVLLIAPFKWSMMFNKEKYEKVYLNPNIDYVFCFLKETIIEEKDCDYYEHNLECDKNDDVWNRTHRKGSNSGRTYAYRGSDPILNSCKYCIEKDKAERYWLPDDAIDLFNKNNKGLFYKLRKKE